MPRYTMKIGIDKDYVIIDTVADKIIYRNISRHLTQLKLQSLNEYVKRFNHLPTEGSNNARNV